MSHTPTSIPLLQRPRADLRIEMFSLCLKLKGALNDPEVIQRNLEQNLRLQYPEADAPEIKRYMENLLRHDESDLRQFIGYSERNRGRRL